MPRTRVGHVDNVDHQLQVAWPRKPQACALPGVDNVDNHFAIVHMIHIFLSRQFFLFAWEFPARGFVDNVDHLDHRFKSARDETST
jgi:hypothetical protein